LLDVSEPAPPLGAGVDLWVKFDTPSATRALMSRVQKPAGPGFGASYVTMGPNGKENYQGLTSFRAAREPRGRLRLVRTGTKLSYQIADGADDFRVLASKEFGTADVIAVRAQASTGWQAETGVDVRLASLLLRAEKIVQPGLPQSAQRAELQTQDVIDKVPPAQPVPGSANTGAVPDVLVSAAPAPSRMRLVIAGLALVLLLTSLAAFWMLRQRRAEAVPGIRKAGTGHVPAPPVVFACPDCAKRIKVNPTAAGTKVQCPSCGQAVPVPATTGGETDRDSS
jgi:hypothetical protein